MIPKTLEAMASTVMFELVKNVPQAFKTAVLKYLNEDARSTKLYSAIFKVWEGSEYSNYLARGVSGMAEEIIGKALRLVQEEQSQANHSAHLLESGWEPVVESEERVKSGRVKFQKIRLKTPKVRFALDPETHGFVILSTICNDTATEVSIDIPKRELDNMINAFKPVYDKLKEAN